MPGGYAGRQPAQAAKTDNAGGLVTYSQVAGPYSVRVARPVNTILRLLLAIWVIGYLVLSCGPMFLGDVGAGGLGLLVGGVLLVPWLVGVLVIGVFVWLTNPRS